MQYSKKLNQWVVRLSKEELPAFAHTARSMASIAANNESSADDLANAILKDSAMTARVLRMANSSYYNPVGRRIHTVSYAIVLLGFETVRNLSLSIAMIDTVLNGECYEQALSELIYSYHAAVQARQVAELLGLDELEYIFIAALLHRLGQTIFWCFPYGQAKNLIAEYEKNELEEDSELQVLGFTLMQLTRALTEEWHLSDLLSHALKNKIQHGDQEEFCVQWGYDIAKCAHEGWPKETFEKLLGELDKVGQIDSSIARKEILKNVQSTIKCLKECGIVQVDQLLNCLEEGAEEKETHKDAGISSADLQLIMIRQLTHMLSERRDLNSILSAVLEGILRALKMDHVLFSWLDSRKNTLIAKQALGTHRKYLLKKFNYSVGPHDDNIFSRIIRTKKPRWHTTKDLTNQPLFESSRLKENLRTTDFFCYPIMQGDSPLGLIYADRSVIDAPLSEGDFETFIHFCDHASIAFQLLQKLDH